MDGDAWMKFSVIVPAYNSSAFIEKGLHSIRKQTFTDYELIVVCDSCIDDTACVAVNYADKVLIRDYHRDGLARNAGIEAAEGEWLLFMDDDDWWLRDDAFEIIADKAVLDAVAFGFYFEGRGNVRPRGNYGRYYWIACWSRAYRKDFLDGVRFGPEAVVSDVGFFNRFMAKEPRIVDIWDSLYYYNYMRPGSQSWRMRQYD